MAGLMDLLGMGGGAPMASPQPGGINPGLAQILAQLVGPQIAPPMAPAAAPTGNPIDTQIDEQIRALSAPEPVVDMPVPAGSTKLQQILAGLADAGSIYGRGLNPYVPFAGASDRLRGLDEQRTAAIGGNQERRLTAKSKSKKTEAELRLRELMGRRDDEVRAKERASDKTSAATTRADDLRRDDERFALQRGDRLADQKADEAYRQSQAAWQKRVDQSLIDSRNRDKDPDRNSKGLAAAASTALVLRNGAPEGPKGEPQIPSATEKLAAGASPEDLLAEYEEELDTMDLRGKDREEAIKYFLQKIGPVIEQHMNESLAAGSPVAGPPKRDASSLGRSAMSRPAVTR